MAIRKVDHLLDPRADFRRKRQRIREAEGFVEQLHQLLPPFLDLPSLSINCGLRHFANPRARTGEAAPPTGHRASPELGISYSGKGLYFGLDRLGIVQVESVSTFLGQAYKHDPLVRRMMRPNS